MRQGYLHICVVFDASESTSARKDESQFSLNAFIGEQRAQNAWKKRLDVYRFSERLEQVVGDADLDFCNYKTFRDVFRYGGATAACDALCEAIDELGVKLSETPEDERPERVVFAIVTDGLDNASVKFRLDDLKRRVAIQSTQFSWRFVFLDAQLHNFREGLSLDETPLDAPIDAREEASEETPRFIADEPAVDAIVLPAPEETYEYADAQDVPEEVGDDECSAEEGQNDETFAERVSYELNDPLDGSYDAIADDEPSETDDDEEDEESEIALNDAREAILAHEFDDDQTDADEAFVQRSIADEFNDVEEHVDEEFEESVDEQVEDESVEQVEEQIDEEFEEPVDEQVEDESVEKVEEQIVEELEEPVDEQVEDESVEKVEEQIDEEFEEPVDEQVGEEPEEQIEEQIDEEFEEPVDEQVDEEADEQIEEQIDEELEEPVDEQVEDESVEQVEEQIDEEFEKPIDEQVEDASVEQVEEQIVEEFEEPVDEQVGEESDEQNEEQVAEEFEEPVEEQVSEEFVEPIDEQVDEEADEQVEEQVDEEFVEPLDEQVEDEFVEPLDEQVEDESVEQVEEQVDEEFVEPLDEQVDDESVEQVEEQVDEEFEEPIDEQVDEEFVEQVEEQVDEEFEEPIEEQVDEEFVEPLDEQVEDESVEQVEEQLVEELEESADEQIDEEFVEPIDEQVEDESVEPVDEQVDDEFVESLDDEQIIESIDEEVVELPFEASTENDVEEEDDIVEVVDLHEPVPVPETSNVDRQDAQNADPNEPDADLVAENELVEPIKETVLPGERRKAFGEGLDSFLDDASIDGDDLTTSYVANQMVLPSQDVSLEGDAEQIEESEGSEEVLEPIEEEIERSESETDVATADVLATNEEIQPERITQPLYSFTPPILFQDKPVVEPTQNVESEEIVEQNKESEDSEEILEPIEEEVEPEEILEPIEDRVEQEEILEPLEDQVEPEEILEPIEDRVEQEEIIEPLEDRVEQEEILEPIEDKVERSGSEEVVASDVSKSSEEKPMERKTRPIYSFSAPILFQDEPVREKPTQVPEPNDVSVESIDESSSEPSDEPKVMEEIIEAPEDAVPISEPMLINESVDYLSIVSHALISSYDGIGQVPDEVDDSSLDAVALETATLRAKSQPKPTSNPVNSSSTSSSFKIAQGTMKQTSNDKTGEKPYAPQEAKAKRDAQEPEEPTSAIEDEDQVLTAIEDQEADENATSVRSVDYEKKAQLIKEAEGVPEFDEDGVMIPVEDRLEEKKAAEKAAIADEEFEEIEANDETSKSDKRFKSNFFQRVALIFGKKFRS